MLIVRVYAEKPAIDATLMIRPVRRGIIEARPTACDKKKMPRTFRFITLVPCFEGCSRRALPTSHGVVDKDVDFLQMRPAAAAARRAMSVGFDASAQSHVALIPAR